MIESSTIIQSIHYLLRKLGRADKLKLIKLLYLADKYHLVRYGRTVTNDDYYAMEQGPVGTTAKDILSQSDFLSKEELDYFSSLVVSVPPHEFRAKDTYEDYEMLSDTDKVALDFVYEHFGSMEQWDLVEHTHKYPEWIQYEDLFKNKHKKRERLELNELVTLLDEDPISAGVSPDLIESVKESLNGRFD
jgi:uncharacterized phage-associated protein